MSDRYQHPDGLSRRYASVHGRFQPFHKGHLTYLNLAFQRCDHLIIGITNPDKRHLIQTEADPKRHLAAANPFTYYERYLMIKGSLLAAGMQLESFDIVPFPIDSPQLLENYCPKVPVYLRDRGAWTKSKILTLQSCGWFVEILTDSTDLDITGTEIRQRITNGRKWQELVPQYCATIIENIGGRRRILDLIGQSS
jgi:cytidyltransferase-like protein